LTESSVDTLRTKGLQARRRMTPDARANASRIICNRVIASRAFFASECIASYLSMDDEVDTSEIIIRAWRANKRVFVPVLRDSGGMSFIRITPDTILRRGVFGIWEPADGDVIDGRCLDLVITPTVAFDRERNRIGMGAGYFDRTFSFLRNRSCWLRPKLFGVAFACQQVEKIPANPWDIRLYRIFTDVE